MSKTSVECHCCRQIVEVICDLCYDTGRVYLNPDWSDDEGYGAYCKDCDYGKKLIWNDTKRNIHRKLNRKLINSKKNCDEMNN